MILAEESRVLAAIRHIVICDGADKIVKAHRPTAARAILGLGDEIRLATASPPLRQAVCSRSLRLLSARSIGRVGDASSSPRKAKSVKVGAFRIAQSE